MVDITPPAGTHLAGSGMGDHRPAQSVLDPLYAKALVLEGGAKRVCLLAMDSTIIAEPFTAAVRQAATSMGFDADAVMVHAVQTHSAPGLGRFMLDPDFPLDLPAEREYLWGSEQSYVDLAVTGAVRALRHAVDSIRPVQVGAASAIRADLAFNRRAVRRDGSIEMPWPAGRIAQPLGPVHLRYLEGPIDPEVGVLCLRDELMRMVAMLLHYTCHPVNVFANRWSYRAVSADWPGAWSAAMQQTYGSHLVPIVLNGCCGNINPWDPFDPDFVMDYRRMGGELARTSCKAVPTISFADRGVLDWRIRRVGLPYRDVPADRQQQADKILSGSPEPALLKDGSGQVDPEWFLAASTRSIEYCRRRMPELSYEIQVFRIGDLAIVGLPGEPFVEGQLAIKLASPARHTYVAHMTTQYVGYLPTAQAFARGGHEANADCTYWAKLAPEALETVVQNASATVKELFV